jgi:phenylpropionate dioxygenase-like ring-hydroxylating dioxygenase large terminal subunit
MALQEDPPEVRRGAALDALTPPKVAAAWYVACRSDELKRKPLQRVILDTPVALFRGEGGPGALLDRCPHRSVPLSAGAVVRGQLQCPYHGWRFDSAGACRAIPGLVGEPDTPGRRCASFPVREQQGFVWIWMDREQPPTGEPFRFPKADDPGYMTVRYQLTAPGSVHAVAENALDVPHTAFLHGGLFRTDGDRKPIQCVVQRWGDRVECQYIGEDRPEGLVGRILSPSGGVVTHYDRFYLPGVVEVEYSIGEENHIILGGALTPISDHETRLFAVVSLRSRLPPWLVRPLVQPIALYIFGQDRVVLEQQIQTMRRFNDATFASTEIDLLGPHIMRLLRQASRGEARADGEPYRREVTMLV